MFSISKKMHVVLMAVVMILALGLGMQGCSDGAAKQAVAKPMEPPESNKTAQAIYHMAMRAAEADVVERAPCTSPLGSGCWRANGFNAMKMLRNRFEANANLPYADQETLIQYFATQYLKHYDYFAANGVN